MSQFKAAKFNSPKAMANDGRAVFMLDRAQSTLVLKDDLVGDLAATMRAA